MKSIEEMAEEFSDGLELGSFSSIENRKMFCDLFTMFAEKYLSYKDGEIANLRTALTESQKRCEIAQKVIAQKNAEPRSTDANSGSNGDMTLNYYQSQAMTTCLPSSANDCYMLFGLVEEVGELCGKVSKGIRKEWVSVDNSRISRITGDSGTMDEFWEQVKSEAGDCLWMLAGLCRQFGWTLEEVAQYNLDKLAKRKGSETIVTHEDH